MDSINDWWNVSWDQAGFSLKLDWFWLLFRRFLSCNQASFYLIIHLNYFMSLCYKILPKKVISFFPEKIKKIINLYIFVFYFYFFWKKEFDLFTATLQQGCISLHSLSLKGHKLVTYWIYDTYTITSANSGSYLHCLWWQGDKQVCKLFIYT